MIQAAAVAVSSRVRRALGGVEVKIAKVEKVTPYKAASGRMGAAFSYVFAAHVKPGVWVEFDCFGECLDWNENRSAFAGVWPSYSHDGRDVAEDKLSSALHAAADRK